MGAIGMYNYIQMHEFVAEYCILNFVFTPLFLHKLYIDKMQWV